MGLSTLCNNLNSLIGSSIPETIAENILRKCEYAIVRLNIINAPQPDSQGQAVVIVWILAPK